MQGRLAMRLDSPLISVFSKKELVYDELFLHIFWKYRIDI